MNPLSLQETLITSDTVFSREIKKIIVKDELSKIVKDIEIQNKERQKETWPEREPMDGLEIEQILEILDRTTQRYWVKFHEEDIFENYDLEGLTLFVKSVEVEDINDGLYRCSTTLKMINEEIILSLEGGDS